MLYSEMCLSFVLIFLQMTFSILLFFKVVQNFKTTNIVNSGSHASLQFICYHSIQCLLLRSKFVEGTYASHCDNICFPFFCAILTLHQKLRTSLPTFPKKLLSFFMQVPAETRDYTLAAYDSGSIVIFIRGCAAASAASISETLALKRGSVIFVAAGESVHLKLESNDGLLAFRAYCPLD